jgi:hypothetical protein
MLFNHVTLLSWLVSFNSRLPLPVDVGPGGRWVEDFRFGPLPHYPAPRTVPRRNFPLEEVSTQVTTVN